MENPIPYAIASEFSRRFILYYDVTRDVFVMNDASGATLSRAIRPPGLQRGYLAVESQ
jgi:hypothetical protein